MHTCALVILSVCVAVNNELSNCSIYCFFKCDIIGIGPRPPTVHHEVVHEEEKVGRCDVRFNHSLLRTCMSLDFGKQERTHTERPQNLLPQCRNTSLKPFTELNIGSFKVRKMMYSLYLLHSRIRTNKIFSSCKTR